MRPTFDATALVDWLDANLRNWQPSKEEIGYSSRHPWKFKKSFGSSSNWDRRIAIGYLYEYLIYDKIVELSQDSKVVNWIVRKGADVDQGLNGPASKLGQNGFYYDAGGLYLRGNGQDLAEFDILIECSGSGIAPVETFATKINLEGRLRQAEYKKNALQKVFAQPQVNCILISGLDLQNNGPVRAFLAKEGNHLVRTLSPDTMLRGNLDFSPPSAQLPKVEKLLSARDLRTKHFDYQVLHDTERESIIQNAQRGVALYETLLQSQSSLVKNIFLGELQDDALNHFLSSFELYSDNVRRISSEDFSKLFRRAIVGLSMPQIRPTLYLRQFRSNYAKFGPSKMTRFVFERNIEAHRTRVYDWLESIRWPVDKNLFEVLMKTYLRVDVIGRQMKKPQYFRA